MKPLKHLLFWLLVFSELGYFSQNLLAQNCCTGPCNQSGPELISNGDFSQWNTGFESDHVYRSWMFDYYNRYGIQNDPWQCNTDWAHCSDHGPGTGNMMVIDGTDSANKDVWRTPGTITVQPNTIYCFNYYATRVNYKNPPKLYVEFNGTPLGDTLDLTNQSNCTWVLKSITWNSGANTSVSIRIRNYVRVIEGNDFALDDISFKACIPFKADAGPDTTVCNDSYLKLRVPSTGSWSYKVLSGDSSNGSLSGNIAMPKFTTTYVLTVTDTTNGCTAYDTVIVSAINCCPCPNSCFPPSGNKIVNGNFEAGNTGFSSQYIYGGSSHGSYLIGTNSDSVGFSSRPGNPGNFLYADGYDTPGKYVRRDSVTVSQKKTYVFCFDHTRLKNSDGSPARLQVKINGVQILLDTAKAGWTSATATWYSGNSGQAVIDIIDLDTAEGGNDFGIDNIRFNECYAPHAGPDLSICNGDSAILPTDLLYPWNYQVLNGDSASLQGNRVKPSKTTWYLYRVVNPDKPGCVFYDTVKVSVKKCCQCDSCSIPGADLIINGDFEAGATGFVSQYAFEDSTTGSYFVRDSSAEVGLGNRLGNGGNFLFADGSTIPNRYVWRQPVPVSPNKKYVLCFDYVNLNTHDNLPILNVRINGASVITVTVPSGPGWYSATTTWMSGSATVANIEFYDNNTDAGGNDFGIDNISFRECTPKVKANAGPDKTICLGTSTSLGIPLAPLKWSYQVLSSPAYSITTNLVSPTRRTTYVLTVTDTVSGCVAYDTVVVDVVCCPCDTVVLNNSINLLSNGDFSSGNTGFSSAYTYGGSLSGGAGTYWVHNNANTYNSNWNKTGNPGNFLFADGASNSSMYVWSQTLSVTPGKTYNLCAEAINLNQAPGYPAINDPTLAILINGSQVATVSLDEWHSWTPVHASWNAGASSSATIDIVSLNTSSTGNDFGIDNLRFSPCDEPSAPGSPQQILSGNNNKAQVLRPELNIYPNPAANSIQVLLPASTENPEKIIITDINGRTVKSIPVPKTNNKELKISLSGLSQGLYTIAVYSHDECLGKKLFMKE